MITEDFIEVFGVIFYRCFDIINDIRINNIREIFGGYTWIFVFDDEIIFSNDFHFVS
jgi:hypothetical protein